MNINRNIPYMQYHLEAGARAMRVQVDVGESKGESLVLWIANFIGCLLLNMENNNKH